MTFKKSSQKIFPDELVFPKIIFFQQNMNSSIDIFFKTMIRLPETVTGFLRFSGMFISIPFLFFRVRTESSLHKSVNTIKVLHEKSMKHFEKFKVLLLETILNLMLFTKTFGIFCK